jgi:hypothetical protein
VDRQLRNIALITLFLAALTIVAVVSPEHNRSTTNTAILYAAIVAAGGSVLGLVLGSVWFGVLRKDLGRAWESRPQSKWSASHDLAEVVREEANMGGGTTMVFTHPADIAVREQGVPCIVLRLEPRRLGFARTRPLQGVTVTCSLSRRAGPLGKPITRALQVHLDDGPRILNAAFARWPDDWFNEELLAPIAGTYRTRWELHRASGKVERRRERVRIADHGEAHDGKARQWLDTVRRVFRHYRGHDD